MPVALVRGLSTASVIGRMRRVLRLCRPLGFPSLAALAMAVVAVACGGDEEQFDDGAEQPAEEATASGPVQVFPSPGGVVSIEPVDVVPLPPGQTISSDITLVSVEKWDGSPRFAPDGEQYASNQDGISVGSLGTSSVRDLSISGYPYWMPDSRSLVVGAGQSADEEVAVYLVSVDGTSRKQISSTTRPSRMEVLSDGRVALARGKELHLVDPDIGAGERLNVTLDIDPFDNSGPFNDHPFSVSPDGRLVALLTEFTHLSVTDLESGETKLLTTGVWDWGARPYGWSSDGRLLAFAYRTRDTDLLELAVYDRQRDTVTVLARRPQGGNFAGMTLTPEGGWLVFAYYPTGTEPENGATYQAINIFTGTIKPLFTKGIGLNLSPDGRRIVYYRIYTNQAERGNWVATISF